MNNFVCLIFLRKLLCTISAALYPDLFVKSRTPYVSRRTNNVVGVQAPLWAALSSVHFFIYCKLLIITESPSVLLFKSVIYHSQTIFTSDSLLDYIGDNIC